MKNKIYHYFVEGQCEAKLINELKTKPYFYLQSGKVEVFNFINKRLTNQRLLALNKSSIIILVYDIDVEKTNILEENVKKLLDSGFEVHHIQSIKCFEDEIVYSTNLKRIHDLYKTTSIDDFKALFLKQTNCINKLSKHDFNKDKIWSRLNTQDPLNKYSKQQDINLIRKK